VELSGEKVINTVVIVVIVEISCHWQCDSRDADDSDSLGRLGVRAADITVMFHYCKLRRS